MHLFVHIIILFVLSLGYNMWFQKCFSWCREYIW